MFEKVNLYHPDKVADRIAGATVDLAYQKSDSPKIATEVLIGHDRATVIIETSVPMKKGEVRGIVTRIIPTINPKNVFVVIVPQDEHLASNQVGEIRCGDNGIFRGSPITKEQRQLTQLAQFITEKYPTDGKYLINRNLLTICQSNLPELEGEEIKKTLEQNGNWNVTLNPLGYWTGGINVDCGATNRKLGSDMGDGVTGGGLHGKDLSKADVSVNIYLHLKAQKSGTIQELTCSIGDTLLSDGTPFSEVVETARQYVKAIGGFERLAEWGLIR